MLSLENTMLLVIDIQGNLYEAMYEKAFLLDNLKKIMAGAHVFDVPIVVTEQAPEKLGPTIPQITELLGDIPPVAKASFSCCKNERFMSTLKGIGRGQILVTGIECHVCVYQTVIDLIDLGYEVNLVTDCVASRTQMNKAIGIESMTTHGAKVTSAEMALFELTKVAKGDMFKKIITILK